MNTKTVLIILGEPNSTFSEILFKYFKSNDFRKYKKKIVIVGCKKLIEKQMKFLGFDFKLKQILNIENSSLGSINVININLYKEWMLNAIQIYKNYFYPIILN